MVAPGIPLLAMMLFGGPLMGPPYTVHFACTVETDVACPTLGPGNSTDFIVRNFTDVGLASLEIPAYQLLPPTDSAYKMTIHHAWIPWQLGTAWRLKGSQLSSTYNTCASEVAQLQLNPALTDLGWLRVRLWQVPSLQPQRCAIAPTVCLTNC